jgi:hypothetical protein
MSQENVSCPIVNTESTLFTAVIDAEEVKEVATSVIPNSFIQTQEMFIRFNRRGKTMNSKK